MKILRKFEEMLIVFKQNLGENFEKFEGQFCLICEKNKGTILKKV